MTKPISDDDLKKVSGAGEGQFVQDAGAQTGASGDTDGLQEVSDAGAKKSGPGSRQDKDR